MKGFIKLYFFLTACIIIISCSSKKTGQDHNATGNPDAVVVYGSRDCIHCVVFTRSLDSAGIQYRFYEVDKDKSLFNEMYQKIQKIKYQGYVEYPVVEVNGRILVSPEFREIAVLLD